jgi:hypothetical protein
MIKSLVDTTGTVNVMTIRYILLLHFFNTNLFTLRCAQYKILNFTLPLNKKVRKRSWL